MTIIHTFSIDERKMVGFGRFFFD